MSSSEKTSFIHLNRWSGSDVPKMQDFNRDNAIIDNVIGYHTANDIIHITGEEREKWNNAYSLFTYAGNGSVLRDITIDTDFVPKWGILFAANRPSAITDFDNTSNYNYFTLLSSEGSMQGASLEEKTLKVSQSPLPSMGAEYRNFNEAGLLYICIVFA